MTPPEWIFRRLEELATVERGKFSARPRNDPKYFGGTVPFVQTGDITGAVVFLTKFTQTLNADGLKVSRLFPKNTILVTIAANIGDTAITTFDVACPDSVVAINPFPDLANVYWLKCALDWKKSDLDSMATQNAQKNINLQVLRPLVLLTPPKIEQDGIAKILSTWDKAIETTEKLIANSKAQKKALMQQLLTGKRRFPGYSEKWRNFCLGDVVHVNPARDEVRPGTKISFIPMDAVSEDAQLLRKEEKSVEEVAVGLTAFRNNDILVAKITPCFENGKGTFVEGLTNGVGFGSTEFHVLRAKEGVNSRLIYHLTNTNEFRMRGEATMQGSAGQKRVSTDFLRTFKLRMPENPGEQTLIANALDRADSITAALVLQRSFFEIKKSALMQQLLTGKRRVKLDSAA